MSTLYATTPAPMALTPSPLARLTRIELRKSVDTRAGRWLLVLVALVALAAAVIVAVTGQDSGHTFRNVLGDTSELTAILLPVLGVLLVSSEWSQHTALTTFTLVPRRARVVTAKAAAGVLLALAATVVCTAVAAAVLVAVGHGPAGAAAAIGLALVFQALNLLLGVGFGLLFRSTPVAIVVYFAAPSAWSLLTGTISALAGTGRWLDSSTAWNHLAEGSMMATVWAQVATAAAVWIVLPAVAGGWSVLRRPDGA
jgi:ABC-type transport system involved in multi-copper enzyme maturation permease subunit